MHKKVQSLLITGIMSANMVGTTVSVFADDKTTEKDSNIKVEQATKPSKETIDWQQTTDKNYTDLWECDQKDNIIVLKKYKESNTNKNIEIPRTIGNKKVELENLNNDMFKGVTRIKVEEGTDKVKVRQTSLKNAFLDNDTLESLDLTGLDVSGVTNLSGFLEGASNLENVNLSGWDVSKVTDLSAFFANDMKLEKINLSGWNVLSVEDLSGFLANASALESVDLSGWDVSKVTDMDYLFYKLNSLKNLNITGWKTTNKLTNTSNMFYECSKLDTIDLSGFNMDNVTDAESMFEKCFSLTSIKGTENWTLKNIKKISSIFAETKLNFINLSNVKLPSTLFKDNMKNIFSKPIEDLRNILVVTNDRKLNTYDYTVDGREAYNFIFDTNGGEFSDKSQTQTLNSITIIPDQYKLLANPTKKDYKFGGWEKINNGILKAKWNTNSSEQNPTDKPENSLQQFIQILDQSVVNVLHQGQGTENDPLILEAKNVTKTVLTDYLDTLNALSELNSLKVNVSAINRYSSYTEYKITIESKNIKKATNNQAINVTLRISNDKADLVKEANRYSKKLNSAIKIPIIATFSDVTNDFWGKTVIEEFASMGIVHGYHDGQFKPNNSITRAEFVKILNNTFGFNKQASTVKFNDVSKDSWYYKDIAIAIEKGYINGRSATTFAPDDNITREEVAMMLTNIMKNKVDKLDKLNEFNDGNQTSDWAKTAMAGAIEAGYFIGDGQKNLNPTKNMTRAEAVSSLSRIKAK